MKHSTPIRFQLVPRANLRSATRAAMFNLLAQHFIGATREQFTRDLEEKDLALLLERDEKLVGFSTLLACSTRFESSMVNVIYSGDTIVAPEAWGTTALPRAWVAGVDTLRATLGPGPCYWLLLTSGFRTYRFLPVFWREFFPRYDAPTPPGMQRLLSQLGSERFGSQFLPGKGIVRFEHPQKLRGELENVPPGREVDPHVSFFLSHNPGHAEGDELVCVTELSPENLTAAGRRMMPPPSYATESGHC